MKATINFILIFSFLLVPSLDRVVGGIYAQNQELFDHTWYFVNGELNGVAFTPPGSYLKGELKFFTTHLLILHTYCEEDADGNFVDFDNTGFTLEYLQSTLLGVCGQPHTDFTSKHYKIYGQINNFTDPPNNPFTYSIQAIDDYHGLTIGNGKGDWAFYTSKLLSNPIFNKTTFTLYPNPVNETLYINNTFNQKVQASIYGVIGKLLHNQTIERNNATIDVNYLNQGMYFVVFESESGDWVSKRFVKK